MSSSANAGPEQRALLAVAALRLAGPAEQRDARRAARRPSAPPASPAAGWIQMFSNGPSRSSRPLATQLSATPPAITRFVIAGQLVRMPRRTKHDLLADHLDRRGQIHLLLRDQALRLPRRAAEQVVEPLGRHRQALAVVEVGHVEPERAVVADLDELLLRIRVRVPGLAVGGQPHQLVLARVHLEPAVVGERRVQHPERVREPHLVGELRSGCPGPTPIELVRPLAHGVERQDGRLLERRREERAGRVRLVVIGEVRASPPNRAPSSLARSRGRWSFVLSPRAGIACAERLRTRRARTPGRSPAAART